MGDAMTKYRCHDCRKWFPRYALFTHGLRFLCAKCSGIRDLRALIARGVQP